MSVSPGGAHAVASACLLYERPGDIRVERDDAMYARVGCAVKSRAGISARHQRLEARIAAARRNATKAISYYRS
jgi:hypothetical protein